MSENFEKTRVFKTNDSNKANTNRSLKNGSKRKKNSKKKFKFKMIYILPISIIICGIIFVGYLWAVTRNDGAIYGDRCQGVVAVDTSKIDSVVSRYKSEDGNIKELKVEIKCRQMKIDLKVAAGISVLDAEAIATNILLSIDSELGYGKANEGDTYSTLFGRINEEQQYEVDFFITNEDDSSAAYPSYGTKHPKNQYISFTRNETKDPALVDQLYNEQSNPTEEEPTEDTTDEITEYSGGD